MCPNLLYNVQTLLHQNYTKANGEGNMWKRNIGEKKEKREDEKYDVIHINARSYMVDILILIFLSLCLCVYFNEAITIGCRHLISSQVGSLSYPTPSLLTTSH